MNPSLVSVLRHRLFPLLQLSGLHALRGTCTALSEAVRDTEDALWLTVARCVFTPHAAGLGSASADEHSCYRLGTPCKRVTHSALLTTLLRSKSELVDLPDYTVVCSLAAQLRPLASSFGAPARAVASESQPTIKVCRLM